MYSVKFLKFNLKISFILVTFSGPESNVYHTINSVYVDIFNWIFEKVAHEDKENSEIGEDFIYYCGPNITILQCKNIISTTVNTCNGCSRN